MTTCKDCIKNKTIPNNEYDYLYEMRALCIINNIAFMQCDTCKRVDIVNVSNYEL